MSTISNVNQVIQQGNPFKEGIQGRTSPAEPHHNLAQGEAERLLSPDKTVQRPDDSASVHPDPDRSGARKKGPSKKRKGDREKAARRQPSRRRGHLLNTVA